MVTEKPSECSICGHSEGSFRWRFNEMKSICSHEMNTDSEKKAAPEEEAKPKPKRTRKKAD